MKKMLSRVWWTIGWIILMLQYTAVAQTATDQLLNGGCIEHLESPEYPAIARQARVQGTQVVRVLLSDQATVQTFESEFQGNSGRTEKYFKSSVEDALKYSRFSKGC